MCHSGKGSTQDPQATQCCTIACSTRHRCHHTVPSRITCFVVSYYDTDAITPSTNAHIEFWEKHRRCHRLIASQMSSHRPMLLPEFSVCVCVCARIVCDKQAHKESLHKPSHTYTYIHMIYTKKIKKIKIKKKTNKRIKSLCTNLHIHIHIYI